MLIATASQKTVTVALVGNPNSGKTTVFNALTNLRQKVANYPGVTVEKKTGQSFLPNGVAVNVVDLPGTYSLETRSPDEKIVIDYLLGKLNEPKPDIVVCIVDAGNLERNLYLVSQVQDLGLPMIVALNMTDEAAKQGKEIDEKALEKYLGAPVVGMVASEKKGVAKLKRLLTGHHRIPPAGQWKLPPAMQEEIEKLTDFIEKQKKVSRPAAFVESLLLVTKEEIRAEELADDQILSRRLKLIKFRLENDGIDWRSAVINARYAWIQDVLKDVVKTKFIVGKTVTDRVDAILTHKFWGWIFFISVMAFMFYAIFTIAAYPMEWIDHGIEATSQFLQKSLPKGELSNLIINGIVPGVGGVLVFLPQILVLFFFIGLLQDTGYLPRTAFIMDRLMSRFGLHGKSFVPLISSFACAIPGVMATRTIENPKDRLVTILVAPLMSCSARIPVYSTMIAVLLPGASAWSKAMIMLTMYFLGIIGALSMATIFKKTLFAHENTPFIMELPPYRLPSLKTVLLHMWERCYLFVRRAGTIILALSVILWMLMAYPKHPELPADQALKQSFAGQVGVMIEPVIKPLGYDWRIGIGLVSSFTAREVFVSTMSIIFNSDNGDSLLDSFRSARWPDARPLFTPLVCIGLIVFYVFAMQCLSTIAIVHRETNGWRWPLFQIFYMTTLAYVFAFLVYQGGRWLGWT